jgi:hypothetical protein
VAIQSTSALNAYLTSASAAPLDAGIPTSATPDQGALAEGSSSADLGKHPGVSTEAAAKPSEDEIDDSPAGAPSTLAASLPALYGRNARSVAARSVGGSISLLA